MAQSQDVDELATLMPRTKIANERAQVDARSLKQYMEASKKNGPDATRRVPAMVHKDSQGFEDIDEFWADDDDDFDPEDDDEDTSISEKDMSVESTTSERQVRLSGMSAEYDFANGGDNNDGDDDNDDDADLSTDTMDLDDGASSAQPSSKRSSRMSLIAAALASKQRPLSSVDTRSPDGSPAPSPNARTTTPPRRAALPASPPTFSKFSTASSPAPSHDFNMSTSFDTGSAMKSVPIPSTRANKDLGPVKRLIQRKSLQALSPIRAPSLPIIQSPSKVTSKPSRDSFADDNVGFDDVSSPFSLQGDNVSPVSNASERDLDAMRFGSKKARAAADASKDSPNVRVALFKDKKKTKKKEKEKTAARGSKTRTSGSDSEKDGDKGSKKDELVTQRKHKSGAAKATSKAPAVVKPAKAKAVQSVAAKTKTTGKSKASKKRPTKRSFLTSWDSDSDDAREMQTDNDKSFNATTSDEDNDNDNDSDYEAPGRVKGARLHARDILDTDDNDEPAVGVRRSKRRRFKPLEWYKGEHYVYERRSSGVGLVIPTVRGIERAGTTTPTKSARKFTKRAAAQRKTVQPFPKSKLPEGITFDDGEWASLYDTTANCVNKMNVICRASEIEHRELPAVDDEPPGFAGQSFNLRSAHPFARWICGRLALPPGAAKEAESVADAVQVFYVTSCQPQSLEVAFGPVTDEYFDMTKATRFLLSPGDEFYVPSRNAYYLKNYSEKTPCELHFTIMKPDAAVATSAAKASADAPTANSDDGANGGDRRAAKKPASPRRLNLMP